MKRQAKTGKAAIKFGRFSGTQRSAFVAQEVLTRRSMATTLEVQTTSGDVVSSHPFSEYNAGHQVTPDGRRVYVLMGGGPVKSRAGVMKRLLAVKPTEGTVREVGISTGSLPAVDDEQVVYFTETSVVVRGHDGQLRFEKQLDPPAVVHGSPSHVCALLPDGRLAVSRGYRCAEKIVDLTVFNLADGREEFRVELPVSLFHDTFLPSAMRADPRGKLVAILGHYAGLVMIDLASGTDVASSYAPDPEDLADGRPTTHAHHRYSDLAFDEKGERFAAAYTPGKLTLWTVEGEVLRREWISTNSKAYRIVTFDGEGVAFFDSMGERARFPI